MLIGSAAAATGVEGRELADDEPCSAAASCLSEVAAAAQSVGVSPLVIEAAHLDPMGPVPGSDMSSAARPRRLTFAAAVSAGSPSLMHGYSPGMSPSSSGGSVVQGCDSAASSEQRPAVPAQEQATGQSLSLLRQRFAKLATG
jgi:hypothetical protein